MIKVNSLSEYVALDVLKNMCVIYCDDCDKCCLKPACDCSPKVFKSLEVEYTPYEANAGWVSVNDMLPANDQKVLIKNKYGNTFVTDRDETANSAWRDGTILAWLALPEYEGD